MQRGAWWWQGVLVALAVWGVHLASMAGTGAVIAETDSPWHLTAGRVIVEAGGLPHADPICFSSDGARWINQNWLANVVLYRAYQALGAVGPLAVTTCLLAATLLVQGSRLRRRRVSPLFLVLALLATLWTLRYAGVDASIRPRFFSALLLVALAWLLERDDPERRLGPWPAAGLVGLLALWFNLHGEVVLGLCLVGADAVGTSLDAWREGKGPLPPRTRWLLGAAAVGALSCALHPQGLDALLHTGRTLAGSAQQLDLVVEGLALDFRTRLGRLVEVVLLVGLWACWVGPRRVSARDALWSLALLHLALIMRRGAVPFVLVAAPVVADQASRALEALRAEGGLAARLLDGLDQRARAAAASAPWVIALALAAYLLLAVPLRARPGVPGGLAGMSPAVFPLDAARFLQERRPPGRIFCDYSAGGLLGWALYPERRVFIDGRTDLHLATGAYERYVSIVTLAPGWDDELDALEVDLVVLPSSARLAYVLHAWRGWEALHHDAGWVVLRRPG